LAAEKKNLVLFAQLNLFIQFDQNETTLKKKQWQNQYFFPSAAEFPAAWT
jgi:hypothetical protein